MGGYSGRPFAALMLALSLAGSSLGGAAVATAADEPGPPPPPYAAPAIVVSVSWDNDEVVMLEYIATTSGDPLGDPDGWSDPEGAWSVHWQGGCGDAASWHQDAHSILLTEKAQDPDVTHMGAYGRGYWPGTYSIVVTSDRHCYYATTQGWEVDDEHYAETVANVTSSVATVTLAAYEPGQGQPTEYVSCTATVPVVDVEQEERPGVILGTVTLGSADGTVSSSVECHETITPVDIELPALDPRLGVTDAGVYTGPDATDEPIPDADRLAQNDDDEWLARMLLSLMEERAQEELLWFVMWFLLPDAEAEERGIRTVDLSRRDATVELLESLVGSSTDMAMLEPQIPTPSDEKLQPDHEWVFVIDETPTIGHVDTDKGDWIESPGETLHAGVWYQAPVERDGWWPIRNEDGDVMGMRHEDKRPSTLWPANPGRDEPD